MQYTGYATYNVIDDKLKVWFDDRISQEDYKKMRDARFVFWHGSKCFVGKWSVTAEDTIRELGILEIEEDDTPDDVEGRVERFSRYADNAEASGASAAQYSEEATTARRRKLAAARAQREFGSAEYWNHRIERAIAHANFKQQPRAIHRRIAELEKLERKYVKEMDRKRWILYGHHYDFKNSCYLEGEALEAAWAAYEGYYKRNLEHVRMRLGFERAMYTASGGILLDSKPIEVGGAVRWNSEWRKVLKVNKKTIKIAGRFGSGMTVDKRMVREILSQAEYEQQHGGAAVALAIHDGQAL